METMLLQSSAAGIQRWGPDGRQRDTALEGGLTMAPPECLALSPDERRLAGGAADGSVWLWDLDDRLAGWAGRRWFVSPAAEEYTRGVEKWRRAGPIRPEYPEGVRALAFAGDGRSLVTVSTRGRVTLWDADSGRQRRLLQEERPGVEFVTASPDGKMVAAGRGGEVCLWDVASGDLLAVLGRPGDALNLCGAFSPDGRRFVCGNQEHAIRRWDLTTGREEERFVGHLDAVQVVAFTADGRTLASGSRDRTLRLWSVASGQSLGALSGHQGPVTGLLFLDGDQFLLSAGSTWPERGELFCWPAAPR
jgi:WD40 repeat protein